MSPQQEPRDTSGSGRQAAANPPRRTVKLFGRHTAVTFLAALVLLLVALPLVDDLLYGRLIESALLSVVLLSAVPAVGARRGTLLAAVLLLAPALVSTWLQHVQPGLPFQALTLAAGIPFVCFVIVCLLNFVLRSPKVNTEVLCAAVSNYLLLGLLFGFAYSLVALLVPNSFAFPAGDGPGRTMERFEALYFSFITLTTVGYGDVLPVSNAARMLAVLEATMGGLYLAVLVARLVSIYSRE